MKLILTFLFFIFLASSRHLKKKRSRSVFTIEKKSYLGEGASGVVYRGSVKGFEKLNLVIKLPKKYDEITQDPTSKDYEKMKMSIENEQLILKHLNYIDPIPNLPTFNMISKCETPPTENLTTYDIALKEAAISPYSRILNSTGDAIVLFEYNCDLFEFIHLHRFNNLYHQVGRIIQEKIIKGLSFLHKSNVLHRDIKLENIMLKAYVDKITECADIDLKELLKEEFIVAFIDFGAAVIVRSEKKLKDVVGTFDYMAPEVFYFLGKREHFDLDCLYRGGYGFAADVYSLAVTMLLIELKNDVFGLGFFYFFDYKKKLETTLEEKTRGKYKALLISMLQLDFTKRPTIENIVLSFFKIKNEQMMLDCNKGQKNALKSELPKVELPKKFEEKPVFSKKFSFPLQTYEDEQHKCKPKKRPILENLKNRMNCIRNKLHI